LLHPDWTYYGTLAQTDAANESSLSQLIQECEGAAVLKLNDAEAELLFHMKFNERSFSLREFCLDWSSKYEVQAICVTRATGDAPCSSMERFTSFQGSRLKSRIPLAPAMHSRPAFCMAFSWAGPWKKSRRSQMRSVQWLRAARAQRPAWTVGDVEAIASIRATCDSPRVRQDVVVDE
jgi:fructokinase